MVIKFQTGISCLVVWEENLLYGFGIGLTDTQSVSVSQTNQPTTNKNMWYWTNFGHFSFCNIDYFYSKGSFNFTYGCAVIDNFFLATKLCQIVSVRSGCNAMLVCVSTHSCNRFTRFTWGIVSALPQCGHVTRILPVNSWYNLSYMLVSIISVRIFLILLSHLS